MSVVVEESEEFVLELWEFLVAGESGVILHVVVKQMDGFWLEEGSQLRVLVDYVSQMDFVDVRIKSAVSDSGPEEHPGQQG